MSSNGSKRLLGWCLLVLALGPAAAQTGDETPAQPTEPAATPTSSEQRVPWWGGRFALYLETAYGTASSEALDTSLETDIKHVAFSTFDPGDRTYGRVTVGWQLPIQRGHVLLRLTGYKEDGGWSSEARGLQTALDPSSSGSVEATEPVFWWDVRMTPGHIQSFRDAPTWNEALHDADGDSRADPNELVYGGVDSQFAGSAPDTLEQVSRTLDLLYQREFADKGPTDRWTGRWATGIRHFDLAGAVPMAAWLGLHSAATTEGDPGLFSEGALLRPILLNQETKGNGPTGMLELQYHFLRRRATAYAQGRAAFLLQQLSTDSGLAYTLTQYPIGTDPVTNALYPTPMQLVHEVDKTAWQVGAEIGLRFRILPGFDAMIEYHTESQQDVLLMPDKIIIPIIIDEAQFGTSAIYGTKDIDHDGWSAGLSFQF